MTILDLKDKKIAILGFGVNNRALIFWLLQQGLSLSICDAKNFIKDEIFDQANDQEKKLLSGVTEWRVGEGYLKNLADFEIVFRSPGIPYLTPELQMAKKSDVQISSQTELFLQLSPCPVIGVTGTKGKSTTAAMIAHLLENGKKGKIYLAGNIGLDPFVFLDELKPEDVIVLELSSFQLQGISVSPKITVVTRVTEDHLNYHQDSDEYLKAKMAIVAYQSQDDYLVVNVDEKANQRFIAETQAQVIRYSSERILNQGVYIKVGERGRNQVIVADPVNPNLLSAGEESEMKIIGKYNLENWAAAVAVGYFIFQIETGDCREGLRSFVGLPHRLEFLKEIADVRYYNDSYSTNPTSTIAALNSFSAPIHLIVGGASKNTDFSSLIAEISKSRVKSVVGIGQEGPKIIAAIKKLNNPSLKLETAANLKEALFWVKNQASSGEIILFSPACASFGEFKNATERGEMFRKLVNSI